MKNASETAPSVVATKLPKVAGGREFPSAEDWNLAQPVRFASDWQGKNEDPGRETEVRLLWTRETLYLKFRCRYRTLTVFPDGAVNGRRDKLWDRDVAEVFLQTDPAQPHRYWETIWTAELALPMQSLTSHFDPARDWRVNFFRVEGASEPRFYSSWQPTRTAQPNFHVPEAFAFLRFKSD